MTRAVHTFEGLAVGANPTTASQGGAPSGFPFSLINTPGSASITIQNTKKLFGSKGAHIVGTDTDTVTLQIALGASCTKVALALPLFPVSDTGRTASVQVIQLRTSAGNGVIGVMTTAGKLSVQNRAGTSQKLFTTDVRTLTFPVLQVWADRSPGGVTPDGTNGALNAAIYDGNTLVESMTALTNVDMRTEAYWTVVQIGKLNAAAGTALIADLDTVTYDDAATGLIGGTLNETVANQAPTVTSLTANRTYFEPGDTVTLTAATADTEGDATGTVWRVVSFSGLPAAPTLTGSGLTRSFVVPASAAGGTLVVGVKGTDASNPSGGTETTITMPVLASTEFLAQSPTAQPAVLFVAVP